MRRPAGEKEVGLQKGRRRACRRGGGRHAGVEEKGLQEGKQEWRRSAGLQGGDEEGLQEAGN